MGNDWIEPNDDDFNGQVIKLNTFANSGAEATAAGLTAADILAMNNATEDWTDDFPAHKLAQGAATSAAQTKNDTRKVTEKVMRGLGKIIQASSGTTNDMRTTAGLPIHDTTPSKAGVPTTRPVLMLDNGQRLQQTLTARDEDTPNSRAKPDGVKCWELRCFIGPTPPVDPMGCQLVDKVSKGSYTVKHDSANGGKLAHFMACWQNADGDRGPWSETVSGTIGA